MTWNTVSGKIHKMAWALWLYAAMMDTRGGQIIYYISFLAVQVSPYFHVQKVVKTTINIKTQNKLFSRWYFKLTLRHNILMTASFSSSRVTKIFTLVLLSRTTKKSPLVNFEICSWSLSWGFNDNYSFFTGGRTLSPRFLSTSLNPFCLPHTTGLQL